MTTVASSGQQAAEAAAEPRPGTSLASVALIGLMAIGSAAMWLGLPAGWLWLASHLENGTSPTMGPYVLLIVGLPVTMFAVGMGLAALDRLYADVTGYDPNNRRVPLPWLKSMRGERGSQRKRTVLDVVMVISVSIAWTAFLIWFFAFAGSSLPK
jgi:hypothetical protein